jgi:hypothetical protein
MPTTNAVEKLPWTLRAALKDNGHYACGLRNGLVVGFSHADLDEDGDLDGDTFVFLMEPSVETVRHDQWLPYLDNNRGLEVRIDDIVWLIEADS